MMSTTYYLLKWPITHLDVVPQTIEGQRYDTLKIWVNGSWAGDLVVSHRITAALLRALCETEPYVTLSAGPGGQPAVFPHRGYVEHDIPLVSEHGELTTLRDELDTWAHLARAVAASQEPGGSDGRGDARAVLASGKAGEPSVGPGA
jgi:hypothetical protein